MHVFNSKHGSRRLLALIALTAISTPLFADLPGLPAEAPSDSARPSDPKPSVLTQTGPIRGSLFKQGAHASESIAVGSDVQPMISFTSVQSAQARRYKKNDILTVVVNENSDSTTNGKGTAQEKTQDFDMAVQQFLQLALNQSGLPTVGTVNNPSNLPEVKFKYDNNTQTDASQERTDTFTARISATVVNVKPNGTLVVEATKQILVDKEEQTFRLSGICRIEDIAVDNTILSTQLANLSLSKQTKGQVHELNKRGWLNRLIDQFSPF